MLIRRTISLPKVFVLGLLALTTAVHYANSGPPEKPKITIAVGGKNLFYYLPLTIAERQGYFENEGLNVTIVDFAGGAKALQALMGGSADMVSGAYEHTISMQAKGQPIKAVVLQARYAGIVLLLPKEKAAQYKDPKDLKGLKIGITAPGSSTNVFVNNLLAQGGLSSKDVSFIGVGAGASAVVAMENASIDAIAHLDPIISQLEISGNYVAVADTRTPSGMKDLYGGDYLASTIYATDSFITKNPNTVQAVVNAIVRALRWIEQATPEQIVAVVPREYKGADESLYKTALLRNLAGYSPDGQISLEAAQNVLRMLKQFDPSVISSANKLQAEKTFDNSFAKTADAKY
ncbi:MAG TPA: ABC transporter substrate-binding protein [Terrimicrobiaceae bacterium]